MRVKEIASRKVEGKGLFAFKAQHEGEMNLPEDANVEILQARIAVI